MKKSVKVILIIIGILILCWLAMFSIDKNRVSNLKMPIFVIEIDTADDGGTGTYYGLGYKVEVVKNISAEYGVQIQETEMYMFGKVIAGAIADYNSENIEKSNNTTKSYIINEENNSNENTNISNNSIETENTNRSPENVTVEVLSETITNTSVKILITDNNEDPYGYGVEFKIQEKVDGEWKYLEYISNDLSWNSIAYIVDDNNQLTEKLNIEQYYGKLSEGTYRIVIPVYDNGYIYLYSNEFEIK